MLTRRLPFLPFLLLTGVFAFSQGQKTTVVGAITDPSGGVIPGAEISLTRVSTNEVFTTISSATGEFVITTLTPDTYQLRVSASGFKTEVRSGLKLEVARTYRLDTQMSVGNVTEEVQVGIGESPAIWIMDSDGKSLALLTRGLDNRGAVGPAWLG